MTIIKLELLTDDQKVGTICKEYWKLDSEEKFVYKISEIAQHFSIRTSDVSKIVKSNCLAFTDEIVCFSCGSPYNFASRTDFQQRNSFHRRKWQCNDCHEKQLEEQRIAQLAIEENRRYIVFQTFGRKSDRSIDISKIALDEAVYLLGFIRHGITEDFTFIRPVQETPRLFTPTKSYDYEVIRKLYDANLILIHPDSPTIAFEFEENNIKSFYLDRVKWTIPPLIGGIEATSAVSELETIFKDTQWPEHWQDEWQSLWRRTALEECIQYLITVLDEHGLPFKPGEKTSLVLDNVLEFYSVSQVYNFIWRAGKDAAAFYLRERVSKQHAANTVVGSIQRQAERARAENWNVNRFGRDRRCPQSVLSEVLFNTVLQIGKDGFDEAPGKV